MGRAAAMDGNEDQTIEDDTQEEDCSGAVETGSQESIAGEASEEYMVQFTKAVNLYQQKEHRCFWCGTTNHLMHDCPKDSDGTADVPLNSKEGMVKKEAQAPQRKLAT